MNDRVVEIVGDAFSIVGNRTCTVVSAQGLLSQFVVAHDEVLQKEGATKCLEQRSCTPSGVPGEYTRRRLLYQRLGPVSPTAESWAPAGWAVQAMGIEFTMTGTDHPIDVDANVERQQWLDRKREQVEADQTNGWHRGILSGPSNASTHAPGWEQRHWTSRVLHRVGGVAAHSWAGIIATVLVVAWAAVGIIFAFPQWWQTVLYSVTGSVTFVMVFVIQHAQERQTAGTQRKLDELIRSSKHADNTLIAVEEAPDEHLKALAHLNLADRIEAGADNESGRSTASAQASARSNAAGFTE